MRFDIKTEGFAELDKALGALPDKIGKRALQRSVIQSMRAVKSDFVSSAPVSEVQSWASKKYNRLRDNIKVGRARNKDKSAKSAYISTGNAFWGNFVEFGTKYMPAKPWFVPTFERVSNRVLDILKTKIKEAIEKELGKLKK